MCGNRTHDSCLEGKCFTTKLTLLNLMEGVREEPSPNKNDEFSLYCFFDILFIFVGDYLFFQNNIKT